MVENPVAPATKSKEVRISDPFSRPARYLTKCVSCHMGRKARNATKTKKFRSAHRIHGLKASARHSGFLFVCLFFTNVAMQYFCGPFFRGNSFGSKVQTETRSWEEGKEPRAT